MNWNWDDLRILLAVHRNPSIAKAAKQLGVNQTTVTRRMQNFERSQGKKLFEGFRGGAALTPVGELFARAAIDLEERMLDLDRALVAGESELHGSIRITLPVMLAYAWVEKFAEFSRLHPNAVLELDVDDSVRSLTRREADIALRYARAPEEHLVGRRVGTVSVAVYGARELRAVPLQRIRWIGWEGPQQTDTVTYKQMVKHSPEAKIELYVNSMTVLMKAARKGVGAVSLPCIAGDAEPDLVRLSPPEPTEVPLWALTHPDLQKSPRVRTAMNFLVELVRDCEERLVGAAVAD